MKLTKVLVMALSATMIAHSGARADDSDDSTSNTTKAKKSQVTDQSAQKKSGDIDDEITNAKLRAVTGAKSAFSFWSQFVYSGASINDPLSTKRPQLNSQNNADPTQLNGQVSGKYRMTEHDSLIAGVGVQFTPSFTNNAGNEQNASTTVATPYVDYDRAFRVGAYQNVIDVAVSKYTLGSDVNDSHLNWSWSLSHVLMREIGSSKRLSLGTATSFGADVYSNSLPAADVPGTIYAQFAFDPILEYAFTDKVSFRTVFRWVTLNEDPIDRNYWKEQKRTESMGVGIGITRDIYIYPNMQWSWGRIASDATTVGFTANINL